MISDDMINQLFQNFQIVNVERYISLYDEIFEKCEYIPLVLLYFKHDNYFINANKKMLKKVNSVKFAENIKVLIDDLVDWINVYGEYEEVIFRNNINSFYARLNEFEEFQDIIENME